jgi:hypothetical protein
MLDGIAFLKEKKIGPPFDPHEERIREAKEEIRKERDRLLSIEFGLDKIIEEITRQKILNDGFLTRIHWDYVGGKNLSPDRSHEDVDRLRDELCDLFVTWDHCNITLVKDIVTLYYFDGDLELRFEESDQILPFVKDYKLVVDFSIIVNRREEVQKELDRINKIISDVGIEVEE